MIFSTLREIQSCFKAEKGSSTIKGAKKLKRALKSFCDGF